MPSFWYQRNAPENIKPIPWLASDAIDYLSQIVCPDFEVLEHGGGGSTLWFAERVKSVTTFETNPAWVKAIKGHDARHNITIVEDRLLANIVFAEKYDLLLIDGEPVEDRGEWLLLAHTVVKPGGWIVLDNANRKEYALQRLLLAEHASLMFTSILQFDHLVTEFYRCG